MKRAWLALAVVGAGCLHPSTSPSVGAGSTTLKDAFAGSFRVGAAVNERQFTGDGFGRRDAGSPGSSTRSRRRTCSSGRTCTRDSACTTSRRPIATSLSATRNGMFVIGHTLVWHSQVPRWVFQDAAGKPVSRDTLLARMRDHIFTVVGRYKGRINGWDVVNEALNDDGTLRHSPWYTIIGEDYLVKAFQFAHEADPGAQLYYNDYSLDNAPKRNGAVALVKTTPGRRRSDLRRRLAEPRQDGLAERRAGRFDHTRDRSDGREGEHHGARHRRSAAGHAESRRRRLAARSGVSRIQSVRRRSARLGATRAGRQVRRPVSRFLHPIGPSSTALPSGASGMATRGSTIGPPADGPATRCCSTAATARSRRSMR